METTDRTVMMFWCDTGIENIWDISHWPDVSMQMVADRLAGKLNEDYNDGFPNMTYIDLRARFNTDRNYKCYGMVLPVELTDEVIYDNFENNREFFEDLILRKGVKLANL